MIKRLLILLLISHSVSAGMVIRGRGLYSVSDGAAPVSYWSDPDGSNTIALYYLDIEQRSNTYYCAQAADADTGIGGSGNALFWKYDIGYYFNNSQYLTNGAIMASVPATFTNVSYSVWWNAFTASENGGIIGFTRMDSKYGEFGIAQLNNTFRSYLNDTAGDFGYTIDTNHMYHIAGTYDGLKYIVYIDGEKVYTNTVGGVLTPGTNCFAIGMHHSAARVATGSAKDGMMWMRTLSEAEVTTLYTNGYVQPCYDCVSTNDLLIEYPFQWDNLALHSESTNRTIMFPKPTWANCPTRVAVGTNQYSDVTYAYDFDGVDDYFDSDFTVKYQSNESFLPLTFGTNDFTLSVWVYPDAFDTQNKGIWGIPAAANGYWALKCLVNSGEVQFELDGNTTTATNIVSDSGLPTNAWSHIWIQRDYGNELAMWINGVKQADAISEANNIAIPNGGQVLTLGSQGGTIYFNGKIYRATAYPFVNTNVLDVYANTCPTNNIEERVHIWVTE